MPVDEDGEDIVEEEMDEMAEMAGDNMDDKGEAGAMAAVVGANDMGLQLPGPDIGEAPSLMGWSDTPEASGPARSFGPQLVINEDGEFVLDQSSLVQSVGEHIPVSEYGPITESTTPYQHAYKKASRAESIWNAEETEQFYEALRLYGTDLFLIHTFFRNRTPAQIKSKFSREMKKYPDKVKQAAVRERKKLTKEVFESMHGTIDTSKHFKPPPSPKPGEEPEPDGEIPGAPGTEPGAPEPQEDECDEEEDFFGEPEYTEEDENMTTNRLMALFD